MSALDDRPFPRGAIIGAGVLITGVVLAVGAVQLDKWRNPQPPVTAFDGVDIAQSRVLRFESSDTGVLRVVDAQTGDVLGDLTETDGFIRTVLSSFDFDRRKQGVTAPPTFLLTLWADGRLSIEDQATGERINLGAFGAANKDVFRRFLPDPTGS
ncbi:MAG: photosynthetic complex assembly protein PuhC [Rhodospirillaceae bacterium]|nr:photosynthetic complex assembly protein PuhC [Rhodospirillaceae bacterium]